LEIGHFGRLISWENNVNMGALRFSQRYWWS